MFVGHNTHTFITLVAVWSSHLPLSSRERSALAQAPTLSLSSATRETMKSQSRFPRVVQCTLTVDFGRNRLFKGYNRQLDLLCCNDRTFGGVAWSTSARKDMAKRSQCVDWRAGMSFRYFLLAAKHHHGSNIPLMIL